MTRFGQTAIMALGMLVVCAQASAETPPFRARGNEPAWTLEKNDARISFRPMDGKAVTLSPVPDAQTRDGVEVYRSTGAGEPFLLVIADKLCADSMSGMPHPAVVLLQVGDRKYSGCGGEPASLLRGEWAVREIGGKPTDPAIDASMTFDVDGNVNGAGSCNRYFAHYALTGEGLTISKGGSTMMMCPDAAMDQERRFLALLEKVSRFAIRPDGALVLQAGDQSLVARRADAGPR